MEEGEMERRGGRTEEGEGGSIERRRAGGMLTKCRPSAGNPLMYHLGEKCVVCSRLKYKQELVYSTHTHSLFG